MEQDTLWYKDAIVYQLHVKAFFDANNDGIGDFPGLIRKLDYIQELGVNTLWLLPFYPSPLKDDGYDIADYRAINPAYGSMRDFRIFIREAHARGLRVITELVINHTSDQHAWFQRARRAKADSSHRNYYVWSDSDKKYAGTRIIFSDTETSNWAWDTEAGQYYWHRFFSHQPDLNFDNPQVLKEVTRIMEYWLALGVDGFRLDAVSYLCEREGTGNESLPETHMVIKRLRAAMDAKFSERILLSEANQWPEDVLAYFGDNDESHMAFHFPLMPRLYMALAQEDRLPITDILRQTPELPNACQWAMFLRNHDELTLEMVTDRERDYLWQTYAADPRARVNLGIRRRLSPLMGNDRRKVELLNALLMSMPGTPVIYYGDEIGMGDNIFLGDRNGVRTPMQWSPDRNGGFSLADPAQLYLPAIQDPVYGYASVNIEAQRRVENSLLNWMRGLIHVVRQHKAFGRGGLRFVNPSNRKIFAYLREYEGETILCVANLSRAAQGAELDLGEFRGYMPLELIGRSRFPVVKDHPYTLTLPPYGFLWLALVKEQEAGADMISTPEYATLVIPAGWEGLLNGSAQVRLLEEALPAWFARQEIPVTSLRITYTVTVSQSYMLMGLSTGGGPHLLALGLAWESLQDDPLVRFGGHVIARVRQGHKVGALYEARHDPGFAEALLALWRNPPLESSTTWQRYGQEMPPPDGALAASPHPPDAMIALESGLWVRLTPDGSTEAALARHLEAFGFRRSLSLLGSLPAHRNGASQETPLALLYEAISHQGTLWEYTLDYLARFLSEARLHPHAGLAEDYHAYFLALMERAGERIGALHQALSVPEPAFILPSAPSPGYMLAAFGEALAQARRSVEALLPSLAAECSEEARRFLGAELAPDSWLAWEDSVSLPIHGHLRLGQLLVSQQDIWMLPLAHTRKGAPQEDLATITRSLGVAAQASLLHGEQAFAESADQLWPLLEAWRLSAAESVLKGYETVMPLRTEDQSRLCFFRLLFALRDVANEAKKRPAWLILPLKRLNTLISAVAEPSA